jgi:hypothetical protein
MKMRILRCGILLVPLLTGGCFNTYTRIDAPPDGFKGIRQYFESAQAETPPKGFHVMQIHGMGDHPYSEYCADRDIKEKNIRKSENISLQEEIAAELGYRLVRQSEVHDLVVDATQVGRFSTRQYVDPAHAGPVLYFTCLSWGDASREIKKSFLGLDARFYENSENERHRAPVNKALKRFVNRSFSDPVIYSGTFGPMIRRALWEGIQRAGAEQRVQQEILENRSSPLWGTSAMGLAAQFYSDTDTVVLSDSLGSRIMFDTFCEYGVPCAQSQNESNEKSASGAAPPLADASKVSTQASALARATATSVKGMFMFANQLPLLELANIPVPAKDVNLTTMLGNGNCYLAEGHRLPQLGDPNRGPATVVAFTDSNDALSYDLTREFAKRCAPAASNVQIVDVVLPNPKWRWLGLLSNPAKAHASGFKHNKRAIHYLVDGAR